MEISIPTFLAALVVFWVANKLVKNYLISRAMKHAYDRELNRVLTDPNSQVKGRFE